MANAQELELFNELVDQEMIVLSVKDAIKELAEQAKEDGIDKGDIGLIKKAAKLHAAAKFEEAREASDALVAKYEELTS